MNLEQFSTFLDYLGAEPKINRASRGSYLPNNFVLCDGLAMNYNLQLIGVKSFVGYEKDETEIILHR